MKCINQLPYIHKDKYCFCKYCGNVLDDEASQCVCTTNKVYYYDEMKYAFYYNEVIKSIIHSMKFYGRYKICSDMAKILLFYYQEYISKYDMLIAVPLNKKRIKQRGYNQSAIIANIISKKLNITFDTKSVIRIKNTKKLSLASTVEQRVNIITNAFSLNMHYAKKLENKNILIIDDIFTTGTTVNEISKLLRNNIEVGKIGVLCLAKP